MKDFIYYPHVVNPEDVSLGWMTEPVNWLIDEAEKVTDQFEIGYDIQIPRSFDEGGSPEEYVQVWAYCEA